MPEMALQTSKQRQIVLQPSKVLFYDLAQAHLMLNQAELAIPYLEKLYSDGVMVETMRDYLARIYYAEGRMTDFKNIIATIQTFHQIRKILEEGHSGQR